MKEGKIDEVFFKQGPILKHNLHVEILCGKVKYPADFLVLGSTQDSFCPIIFGRPFLNTVNAKIDCNKDIVSVGLVDMSHEFNFAKFSIQPHDK